MRSDTRIDTHNDREPDGNVIVDMVVAMGCGIVVAILAGCLAASTWSLSRLVLAMIDALFPCVALAAETPTRSPAKGNEGLCEATRESQS